MIVVRYRYVYVLTGFLHCAHSNTKRELTKDYLLNGNIIISHGYTTRDGNDSVVVNKRNVIHVI